MASHQVIPTVVRKWIDNLDAHIFYRALKANGRSSALSCGVHLPWTDPLTVTSMHPAKRGADKPRGSETRNSVITHQLTLPVLRKRIIRSTSSAPRARQSDWLRFEAELPRHSEKGMAVGSSPECPMTVPKAAKALPRGFAAS